MDFRDQAVSNPPAPAAVASAPTPEAHLGPQLICQTGDVDEMACSELVERVTDYLEGALQPDDLRRVRDHLDACESCESYVAQMRAAIRVTGSLSEEGTTDEVETGLIEIYRQWITERDDK
ncbi:hypothetical protein GCM10023259_095350 [Thermocatellispora tengchongensis]